MGAFVFFTHAHMFTFEVLGRPVPIILFFLPIILFRISLNISLLFLRIDPIILNYSHKNSEKLNDNNCNISEVSM